MSRHRKRRPKSVVLVERVPTGIMHYQWCPGLAKPWVDVQPAITLIYSEIGHTTSSVNAGGCFDCTAYFYGLPTLIVHPQESTNE